MKTSTTRQQHDAQVAAIQAAIRAGGPLPAGTTCLDSHTTHAAHGTERHAAKALRALDKVVEAADDLSWVWVEPGMTMDALAQWSLDRGHLPLVVPEFKGITAGGAVAGGGLESSSFRYGQFSDGCLAYEVVLANGDKVVCSPDHHADLFYGIVGSFGTVASLSCVKVRLRPAKRFVRLKYTLVEPVEALFGRMAERSAERHDDYIDAMILDRHRALLMTATQSDGDTSLHLQRFDRPWSPWFGQHAYRQAARAKATGGQCVDLVPLYDYIFRYDRAAFWMGRFLMNPRALVRHLTRWQLQDPGLSKHLQKIYRGARPEPNPGWIFRTLLAGKMSSTALYRVLHLLPEDTFANTYMVQDFYTPTDKTQAFWTRLRDQVDLYPLWLCPLRGSNEPQWLSPHHLSSPTRYPLPDFINVGVYGIPGNVRPIRDQTHDLERLVNSLGGRRMLYAVNTAKEEEFWKVYRKDQWQALRHKYHGDNMPDLYSKLH